jgi:hypothetical protein
MSGDGYTAQTTDLQSAAPQYDSVAQQVQQVYTTLSQALEGEGACWGNDDSGQTFGSKYCPPAVSALEQMSNTNQGLQSMVDGICSWAKNYIGADQEAQASATQISSPG